MSKFSLCVAVFYALVLTGCATMEHQVGEFSLISTQNINTSTMQRGSYVEGKACTYSGMFADTSKSVNKNRLSAAVENALKEAYKRGEPADALTKVSIKHTTDGSFGYGAFCTVVKGEAVSLK